MIVWRCFAALLVLALHGLQVRALSYTRNVPRHVSRVSSIEFSPNLGNLKIDSTLEVELGLAGETRKIRFQLRPNHEVISRTADLQHLLNDGSSQALPRSSQPSSFVYKGTTFVNTEEGVEWAEAGWARMSYQARPGQRLLQGAFRLNGKTHHLTSDSNYLRTRLPDDPKIPNAEFPYLLVWRDSDLPDRTEQSDVFGRSPGQYSFCDTETHRVDATDVSRRQFGQQPFDPVDVIGSTEGCPSTRRVALLGVATDCTYTSEFQSVEDARDNVISQINIASQIYEDTFNLSLVIQNLTISDASCPADESLSTPWNVPCTQGFDISARLSSFSEWRGQFDDGNAIWTLMSACNTGQTVGIAWLGSVCSRGARTQTPPGGRTQSVASTNVVVRTRDEWQVIAHEIGHNFGATHDCTSQSCGGVLTEDCCPLSRSTCDAGEQYIMNPITGSNIRDFSGCSVGTICTGIGRGVVDTTCFVSPEDAPDINESECGNGIVEGSEACDCGGEEGCPSDSCCDPATCQLRENAECDPTNDQCCTDSCLISSRGQVCRDSTSSCDPEETCDGTSAQCPEDIFEPDGQACGDGLRCASGHCTSRDIQCTNAYNETGAAVEACNDNSCQLFCNIPGQGCSRSSQNFLDGTLCGNGGTCVTGSCERPGSRGGPNGGGGGDDDGSNGGDWFERNRSVVIGVASGVGGLIVIIIVAFMVSKFRQRNNAKRLSKRWPGSSPMVAQYVHGQRPAQFPAERILYR